MKNWNCLPGDAVLPQTLAQVILSVIRQALGDVVIEMVVNQVSYKP